jgi:hypothetical protein
MRPLGTHEFNGLQVVELRDSDGKTWYAPNGSNHPSLSGHALPDLDDAMIMAIVARRVPHDVDLHTIRHILWSVRRLTFKGEAPTPE